MSKSELKALDLRIARLKAQQINSKMIQEEAQKFTLEWSNSIELKSIVI